MKRTMCALLLVVFLLPLSACGKQADYGGEILSPAEVVARWFYSHSLHDEEMYNSTVIEKRHNTNPDFSKGIVSIKIYEFTTADPEKSREKAKEIVDAFGDIYGVTDTDHVSFVRVHFDWETDGTVPPTGEQTWSFTLVQDDAESPWFIADWGQAMIICSGLEKFTSST